MVESRRGNPNAAERRPERKAVTLGDFMPTGSAPTRRPRGRRHRLPLSLGGIEGSISSRVPQWSTRDRLTEMPAVPEGSPLRLREIHIGRERGITCTVNLALPSPKKRRRRTFAGLRGIVSNHFPTYTVRAYRSWRGPAAPALRSLRPVVPPSPPPAPAGPRRFPQEPATLPRPPPHVRRAPSTPRGPLPRSKTTVLPPSSRDTPVQVAATTPGSPESPVIRQPDIEDPTADDEDARVQLIVEIGGKTTAVHAQATDWHWVSSLGLTDLTGRGAVEQIVIRAIQRSLGLPTVSRRHMRLEPVQRESPSSWEGLAEYAQSGGTFRVVGRLYGGRNILAVSSPLIEQEKDLAPSPAQSTRHDPPSLPLTPNAQI